MAICRCEYPSWDKISICAFFTNNNCFFLRCCMYPALREVPLWFICLDVVSIVIYRWITQADYRITGSFLLSLIITQKALTCRCCFFQKILKVVLNVCPAVFYTCFANFKLLSPELTVFDQQICVHTLIHFTRLLF